MHHNLVKKTTPQGQKKNPHLTNPPPLLTRLGVLQLEILILKLVAIDAFATSSITLGEVTPLAHELRNDAVESGALVTKAFLTSAEYTEVLCNTKMLSWSSLTLLLGSRCYSSFPIHSLYAKKERLVQLFLHCP